MKLIILVVLILGNFYFLNNLIKLSNDKRLNFSVCLPIGRVQLYSTAKGLPARTNLF